jgi:DNA gyrase subunit A
MLSDEDRKNSEIILISKGWQTIRMSFKWIRKTSRVTQWVILTKLKKDWDKVVRASVVKEGEEPDADVVVTEA